MSSAIAGAVMRYAMMRLSPMSITPAHPRIGVMAYGSPGSGERTSNEPKYVRWRGGHFSVEMFTSVTVFAAVLVSVLIIASLFLKPFGPTQPLPTRGIIPSGLAWEGLFQFLSSHLRTGAQFLAACRRPAKSPNEDQLAACAARGRRDFAFCFRSGGLSRPGTDPPPRRGAYLRVGPGPVRLPRCGLQPPKSHPADPARTTHRGNILAFPAHT